MARPPKTIRVEQPRVRQGDPEDELRLCFTQIWDPKSTSTNVERLSRDELVATRDAIDAYLGET